MDTDFKYLMDTDFKYLMENILMDGHCLLPYTCKRYIVLYAITNQHQTHKHLVNDSVTIDTAIT